MKNLKRLATTTKASNAGARVKTEIAFAQTYFAVQTRKQEIIVDNQSLALIRSKGDQALFGGFSTNDMKRKLGVPVNRPLADFLPTLTILAKGFSTELTSHNVIEKDLKGETAISNEHVDNNLAVRKILGERGVKPENCLWRKMCPKLNDVSPMMM